MKKCRGRPKCPRRVKQTPEITYFKPRGVPLSELEVVSRRAFWEDLKAARTKTALALTTGKAIEIKGGNYISAETSETSENTDP
jgi:hypothetical protein